MSSIVALVTGVLETYRSAVATKDVDAFMRLYAVDVRIFDTWGVWAYDGAAAWRVAVAGWFSSLGDERCRVVFDDVRITGGSDFAAMSAVVTYAAVSAQGTELRSMQNRISWVLAIDEQGPRIVHEHTSAPVGFDDLKALLRRPAVRDAASAAA